MNLQTLIEIARAVADITVVAWIVYAGLRLMRGTRAFRILLGLIVLVGMYTLAYLLKLRTLFWMLDTVSVYLVLAMIVLFQRDIRRALARAGGTLWAGERYGHDVQVVEVLQKTCFRLAGHGVGALIAVEQSASLEDYMTQGEILDAQLSEDLLVAIFQKESPIHDGAVMIRDNRIAAAGCFLPLAAVPGSAGDRAHGTRHRAARGLSEETDALVLVVSEERRTVSIVHLGAVTAVGSPEAFRTAVHRTTDTAAQEEEVDSNLERALEKAEEAVEEERRLSASTPAQGSQSVDSEGESHG